jgi:hypothetical protein
MSRTSRPKPAAKSERRAPAAGGAARSAKRRGSILASLEDVCARSGDRIVFGLALATATILSVYAALKYRFYLYDDFDLAIFHQATLQLLRGSLFTSIRGMAWPGDHSSLVLILIAPLAALIRHPLLLPVLQAIALSFSALVVHRIARAELGSAAAAVGRLAAAARARVPRAVRVPSRGAGGSGTAAGVELHARAAHRARARKRGIRAPVQGGRRAGGAGARAVPGARSCAPLPGAGGRSRGARDRVAHADVRGTQATVRRRSG